MRNITHHTLYSEIPPRLGRTLSEALQATAHERWAGRRGFRTNTCQTGRAIADLAALLGDEPDVIRVEEITPAHVQAVTAAWKSTGLSPSTINKRVGCLGLIGVQIRFMGRDGISRRSCFVPGRKGLKWWLRPEDEGRLATWIGKDRPDLLALLMHVLWTTRTGFRVEETLRLQRRHFVGLGGGEPSVTVPGTKTVGSGNVTLALSREAAQIASLCFARWPAEDRMIPRTYETLREHWQEARAHLGVLDEPLATLKALRRSAARHLHARKAMPLDMLRGYLRHSDVRTTMGYLRLTGGYSQDEMRRYL